MTQPVERFLEVNGARLWTVVQGAGEPMLLLNGGFGLCDYLGDVAVLVEDRVRVHRFEPRGCGRSSSEGPFDLETMIADIEALRIAFDIQRWIVGGHSAGADLALAYALTHPRRTRALVHLAGTGVQDDRQWKAAYERGRAANLEPDLDWAYPFNAEANRQGNASWRGFIKRPALLLEIAQLNLPALFVCGVNDIRPSWPVEQLAHLIPNARYVSLKGAGHYPWVNRPAELRTVLQTFLNGLAHNAPLCTLALSPDSGNRGQ